MGHTGIGYSTNHMDWIYGKRNGGQFDKADDWYAMFDCIFGSTGGVKDENCNLSPERVTKEFDPISFWMN